MVKSSLSGSSLTVFSVILCLVCACMATVAGNSEGNVLGGISGPMDGSNDMAVAVRSVFPGTSAQSFTVEAWVYPTAIPDLLKKYIVSDDAYDVYVDYNPAAANNGLGIGFRLYGASCGEDGMTEFRDIGLNQWNHVALVFSASTGTARLAINGRVSSTPFTFSSSGFCQFGSQVFAVGGISFSTSPSTFMGYIDEVRISDTVRYTQNFTPSAFAFSPDQNTRGLWHFDESPGTTFFTDSSAGVNDLTGRNGAQTDLGPLSGQDTDIDFNGDGESDILWWHNTTGEIGAWLMDGTRNTQYIHIGIVSDTRWRVVGAGDFNGDGESDILWWHNTTGEVGAWLMDGTRNTQYVHIGTVSDTRWRVVGAGDSSGDSLPPPAVSVTGTWRGPYNSTVFGAHFMTLTLQQAGDALTGTFSSSNGGTGTISGTISGTTATVTITLVSPDCMGSFSGAGTVNTQTNPHTLSIQFSGATTCGGSESGAGILTRQ